MYKKDVIIGTWAAIGIMLASAVGTTIILDGMTVPFTLQTEKSATDWWMK